MCGIAGYFGSNPPNDDTISKTLSIMRKRGPDNQSSKSISSGHCEVRLLHSRLSIIDLDTRSNQPFTIGTSSIVYNGEIYNYIELRKRLDDLNIKLITNSDTEILLNYYLLYGENCVEHFEGMWAFAIFDLKKHMLFLSRDRFAEKPLYYLKTTMGFYFASETSFLKSLSEKQLRVNKVHLIRNLVHGYKSLYKYGENYYKDVNELGYAQNLKVNADGISKPYRYWNPQYNIDLSMSLEDAIEGTKVHLNESVRMRLRSDTPLAFCLSGGVDSASLVSIAAKIFNAKIETFSIIDKDERYNEYDNIMSTIKDIECNYNLLEINKKGALPRLKELIQYHDSPLPTISSYIYSLIAEAVNKKGFRVSLSGNSADELFTGYYDHYLLHLNEMKQHKDYHQHLKNWTEHVGGFIRNPFLKDPNLYQKKPSFRKHIFDRSNELKQFLREDFQEDYQEVIFTENLLRNRMLNELFHEATPVILNENDLSSMYYSTENRSPFLDSKLMKFAYTIPPEYLIKNGYSKFVLRQSTKGILNDKVRLDRRKKGFNASINSILDFQDPAIRESLLNSESEIFSIIDKTKMEYLLSSPTQPNHFSKFIFNFLNAKIFMELN